ncbi:hypothetical protein F4Y93_12765 [Candidatus Poribacteria bacterium]|nr:hypothetical protein [Candidatus Poribacteria bacterium]
MTDTPFLVRVIPGLTPSDVKVEADGYLEQWATGPGMAPWRFDDGQFRQLHLFTWLNANGYHAPSEPLGGLSSCFDEAFGPATMVLATGEGQGRTGRPDPARMSVVAKSARIVSLTRQPVIVDSAVWDNRPNDNPRDFSATVETEVEDSVESHWDVSHGLTLTQDVKVGIGPADAEGSVAYVTTWGEGGSHSTTKSVSTTDTISASLDPGELAVAALVAQRGVLTIEADYAYQIVDGWLRARFYSHDGRGGLSHGNPVTGAPGSGIDASWIAAPVRKILYAVDGEADMVKTQKQTLTVDFFADAVLASYPLQGHTGEVTADDIDNAVGGTKIEQVFP